MSRRRPQYNPKEVARLARSGRVVATLRVVNWLVNHDYDAAETLTELLESLETSGIWLSSCRLANGEIADEYAVRVDGEDWYLKFQVEDKRIVVNVWSCWWEGTAH